MEPERLPSNDYSKGMRRGSNFFSGYSGSAASLGGIANKGFEQERSKSNPLFSGISTADIQEEGEDATEKGAGGEVTVEVGGVEAQGTTTSSSNSNNKHNSSGSSSSSSGDGYDNRKPSLATMREHRENHMNDQLQSVYACDSPACPTAIVVHCPSDEELKGVSNDDVLNAAKTAGQRSSHVTVDMTRGEGEEEGSLQQVHVTNDNCNDSAFASGAASPAGSESNSTCEDVEDSRM